MSLPPVCACAYYRKRGSASYIVREVRSVRERERYREREIDGSDVIIVALKLAISSHFPLPKNCAFRFSLHTSCLTIVGLKFTLSVAKKFVLFVPTLSSMARAATSETQENDQILPSPIVLPIEKMNQINTKNYWK